MTAAPRVAMAAATFAATLAAMVAAWPAVLPAQQTADVPFRGLSLGGGAALSRPRLPGDGDQPGLALQIGGDVARVGSPIGARLTGTLYHRGNDDGYTRMGGLGLDFKLLRPRGTVRPYALLGAGAYRLRREVVLDDLAPGTAPPRFRAERTSASLTAGVGVMARLGGRWWYAESRLTGFPQGGGVVERYAPVIVGMRF